MSEHPNPDLEPKLPTPQQSIHQQANDSTVDTGMQAVIGNDNVLIQGDNNVVTFQKTLQISVDEIKTREFLQISPYKGLKKFDLEDKDRFFGRDQFLKSLIQELEQTNLILLLGASGSGKSSVVRAGLIPWLLQKYGSQLVSLTFTPDVNPFESLYATLLSKYAQKTVQFVREAKVETLTLMVRKLKQTDNYWLIFIDQFEELFTTSQPDKRNNFIATLIQLTKAKEPRVKVIATMRADFLDRLSPYPQLVKVTDKHRPIIAQMQSDELRLAIEQPAAYHGVVFEPGLVEEIIKDVQRQAGYLPLLQYTLNLLWETEVKNGSVNNRTLNISTYRQLGGVRGALQQRVDKIYDDLSGREKIATQRIFLKLVDIGGNKAFGNECQPVRRRALRSEFNDVLENSVLIKLINENFLVSNYPLESQQPTVEIAHETLLISWGTLNNWMMESRNHIALKNRLNDDVYLWFNNHKSEKDLWRGSRLEKVKELRKDLTFNQVFGGFNEDANQFIDASIKLSDRQRHRTIIGLTCFLVIVMVLAGFIEIQRRKAIDWAQRAEKQRKRADISEIQALNTSSEVLVGSGRLFDALIQSLKAGEKLQDANFATSDAKNQTLAILRQAVYSVRERNRLKGHNRAVNNISINRNGNLVASTSDDGTVKLWDISGRQLKTLTGHNSAVKCVSFSPDESIIVTGSEDKTVKLWNMEGKLLKTFTGYKDTVTSVSFSPDGATIATGSNDGTVKLWNTQGELMRNITGHGAPVYSVSFSPGGTKIASAGGNTSVKIWNTQGNLLQSYKGHSDNITSVSFSPDGKKIASASFDNTVVLWNLQGEKLTTLRGHREALTSVSFSSDGKNLVTSSYDDTIKLWSLQGKEPQELQTLIGHDDNVTRVVFGSDSKVIASASWDNTIRIWENNPQDKKLQILTGHNRRVTSIVFSPDNKMIASASYDNTVRFWNRLGELLPLNFIRDDHPITSISFSRDGQKIVSATWLRQFHLWDISGKQIKTFTGHSSAVNSVSISPNSKTIVSAGEDNTVKLWSSEGRLLHTLNIHSSPVISVGFSPDGQTIASASDDNTVILWDLQGNKVKTLRGHKSRVTSVNFSPDSKNIATGSDDSTAKLWNTEGKELKTLTGHYSAVTSISFSPDSKTIATGSYDKTVKLWNLKGEELATLKRHNGAVTSVVFSPDGKSIASASDDKTVIVWNFSELDELVDSKKLMERGCRWLNDYLVNYPNEQEALTICKTNTSISQRK